MAGLRPPNRRIQPPSAWMVFVSTVGFMVPTHFGRTVKKDQMGSADCVSRHAAVLSLETRDIISWAAPFFVLVFLKIYKWLPS